ncbi:hypothetical protein [Rivularia sp. UHCC 0363]|uniref:hypothetical protein n=1 Tax=Rivularia sp. UHCC 0363 TaxID=3110244 RepID=UPI002B20B5AD|nr:hypothetical protein [Rivularia sp. UHCC 0363]MEA5592999.1 hypothetical protein [Rivularia sp. UHCC 0363]
MVRRGKTIPELRWKDTPDFVEVAKGWSNDAIKVLVKLVWEGYDLLVSEILSQINCDEAKEQLERSITQSLERKIRKKMTGDEPFDVQHEVYEIESSQSAQAQPPQYDIAFYLISNERIIWPLEAKVLKSDGAVGEYIKEIKDNFITCRYAPFSSQGGMLGYLFSGDPNKVFSNIETKVPCTLNDHPYFPKRDHKTSDHQRLVPPGKSYPAEFRCHHLLLKIIATATNNIPSV